MSQTMRPVLKADLVKLALMPDRLAGADILRGVADVGGVRIQSSTVVFPPTATQSPPPVIGLEEQTHRLRARLVAVAEQAEAANPAFLTLVKFKAKFSRAIAAALFRASWIERERIKAHLVRTGLAAAAHAVEAMPLPEPYRGN